MAKYYPVMMDLEGRRVLVVGGGPIATRKAGTMVEYGAAVEMIAPEFCPEARELAATSSARLIEREYRTGDVRGAMLVVASTNDPDLHVSIKAECDAAAIACNVVDVTGLCSFIVPSIIRRGELMITISTDGLCPSYSKYQRQRMEKCCFGDGCERLMYVVAAARNAIKGPNGRGLDDEQKFELLNRLIEEEAPAALEREGVEGARSWAEKRIVELLEEFLAQHGAAP